MKYLKVWTSFREVMEPLSDAETGRLFVMMLVYAESFTEPDEFTGNERYVWPAAKQWIDLTFSENLKQQMNGKKGGRPKTQQNPGKPIETQQNPDEPTETLKVKESKVKKSKVKESNNNPLFDRFWEAYPRKVAKPVALKRFMEIDPDEETLQKMLTAIEKSKRSEQWTKDNGQFIPHPATWLHQRRWEDDIPSARVKTLPVHDYEQRDYTSVQTDLEEQQRQRIAARIAIIEKGAG